jgi:hypothetical protein
MFISAMSLMREVTAAWRRLLIEEDAVDAVADAQRVLVGLDVDVRRLAVDRALDEQVHQAHDRRLERHVAEVVDVLVALGPTLLLHALDDALERRGRAVVRPVDCLGDRLRRADDELHAQARELAEVVHNQRVQRVRGRDRQDAVLDADGAHRVLAEVLRREVLDERQGGGELLAREEREVLLLRNGAQHVLARHRAHRHERLAQPLARRLPAGERLLDGLRGREPFPHENFSQQSESRRNTHAMLA